MTQETIEIGNESPKYTRRSRALDSRNFESRTVDQRPTFVYRGGSKFNVPLDVTDSDPDHVYSYVVYSSGNFEQRENYYEAMDRGWKPVAASQHPSLARNYNINPFGTRDEGDQLIRKGGQVLMKRTIEEDDAEKAFYDAENRRQQYMSDMYKQQDPRMPRPFLDDRSSPRRG